MRSKQSNFHIRGIWIADVATMGLSSVLNEDKLSMDCESPRPSAQNRLSKRLL